MTNNNETKTAKTETATFDPAQIDQAVKHINENFVNATQAADILGVTKATLSNWKSAEGKLQPSFKIDRTAFYEKSRVEKVAQARKALAEAFNS